MSLAGRIARRTFLVGSAAVAGGVAFGWYRYASEGPNPLLASLGEGEVAITPFVRIDADGVTLITPRADMGQGAYSIQAHLLAEELDVDPHAVRLDPGPPDPVYYNGALLADATPFPAYDESGMAESARRFADVPAKLLGLQVTGGSTTVPDMFDRLRHAGAVARETLKRAAAAETGIAVEALRTEGGAVVLPDDTRLAYAVLAVAAAQVEPMRDVALRPRSTWRLLGKPMRRTDIVAKSTGAARYGIDVALPGMLHATVRTNPAVGGAMLSYDASAAVVMRGVAKVVPVAGGLGVIADNTWRAFRAAAAIDIDWGPAPYPADDAALWQVHEETLAAGDAAEIRLRNDGDVETAQAAGQVIEATYRLPYLAHAPLEPMNATARVADGRVDLWTGTQVPGFLREKAADLAGVDVAAVHVHVQQMGGSFGRRLEITCALQAVELAMAADGRPVKLTWSREEDFAHDYPRPMHMARARGTVRDGRIESLDLDSVSASVMASWFGRLWMAPPGPDPMIVMGAFDQPFAIPNYRVTGHRVPELVPVSSWRAPGAGPNAFFHESFVDELCHAAGADPLEERLRLCLHEPSRRVLEAVGEMSGWDGTTLGANRGRGLAFCLSFGVPVAQVVEVTATADGVRIDRVFVAADVGEVLDPVNFEAQVTGSVIWGLGHAMNCALTYEGGAPVERNYDAYHGMRLYQVPEITVRGLEIQKRIRGIGEPAVPPAAPALANAIFAATGLRLRRTPFDREVSFL